jgi:hypothetical protein
MKAKKTQAAPRTLALVGGLKKLVRVYPVRRYFMGVLRPAPACGTRALRIGGV